MKLPLVTKPELFGLNQNAEILASIHEGNSLSKMILGLLPRVECCGIGENEGVLKGKCEEIL